MNGANGPSSADGQPVFSSKGDTRGLFPDTEGFVKEQVDHGNPAPEEKTGKFLGRYDTPEELEEHAKKMQSERDQLSRHPLISLAPLFQQYPELWDDLESAAAAREAGNAPNVGVAKEVQQLKAEDFVKDDGMGGKTFDPEKFVAAFNEQLAASAKAGKSTGSSRETNLLAGKLGELELKQHYIANGIPIEELQEDLALAERIAGSSHVELLGLVRQIKAGDRKSVV